ncbi:putative Repressible alkaline phosphatase [Glarea lozoyensis 74030]|uniref:Alkaline phosphatase n=1 Tax=Glarea lozoyensis (strain ATCC 74030 / MF5533) TaxID=1104152 RepID=H0EFS7_GLAL7|nr:putative Repressible alkaline phosphatase [Glarea lozoyensis 74030]
MSPNPPLFASDRRSSSSHSEERAAAEDTALLGNQRKDNSSPQQKSRFWREIGLFAWALIATAAVIVLAVYSQHQGSSGDGKKTSPKGKKNLIFMVSDGMGPASLSMTRSFRQFQSGLPIDDVLVLDQHFIGSSRTRSSNSLVTDSAAGATAFSCGMKSYNGAISKLPDHSSCGTVLEAAKRAGYMTGLVVTTSITDATPACFASHVDTRAEEDLIAQQEVGEHPLGRMVDLIFGGGRCHFLPNTTSESCRGDGRDITKLAREKYGWNYIDNRKDFDGIRSGSAVKLPLLGLFARYNFPYEDSDKGFFLMIEGSRIDHAGHGNDPAAQVNEVLAYDKAFASVLEFLDRSKTESVLVSTSDHETGGLSIARQLDPTYPEYLWYPEVLNNVSSTAEHSARRLASYVAAGSKNVESFIRKELVKKGLGIKDATDAEIKTIIAAPNSYSFASMISRRAQIGWSTHGHSAVDVNIYGTAGSERLNGNHENTEVGKFLRDYLDLNVDAITKELNEKEKAKSASTEETIRPLVEMHSMPDGIDDEL